MFNDFVREYNTVTDSKISVYSLANFRKQKSGGVWKIACYLL